MTKSDRQYLDQKFDQMDVNFAAVIRKFEEIDNKFETLNHRFEAVDNRFEELSSKYGNLLTIVSNAAGDIAKIEENTTVLSNHNSEHFDKDEEQDKRLTRVETHLKLPAFA